MALLGRYLSSSTSTALDPARRLSLLVSDERMRWHPRSTARCCCQYPRRGMSVCRETSTHDERWRRGAALACKQAQSPRTTGPMTTSRCERHMQMSFLPVEHRPRYVCRPAGIRVQGGCRGTPVKHISLSKGRRTGGGGRGAGSPWHRRGRGRGAGAAGGGRAGGGRRYVKHTL